MRLPQGPNQRQTTRRGGETYEVGKALRTPLSQWPVLAERNSRVGLLQRASKSSDPGVLLDRILPDEEDSVAVRSQCAPCSVVASSVPFDLIPPKCRPRYRGVSCARRARMPKAPGYKRCEFRFRKGEVWLPKDVIWVSAPAGDPGRSKDRGDGNRERNRD
jgi:hypothetical protein